MSKIDLKNCNKLKFLHKNHAYTIKDCSDIKNFALDISLQSYNIYDDYGARLEKRMKVLLDEIQNNGTHSEIKKYVLKNCPEICI